MSSEHSQQFTGPLEVTRVDRHTKRKAGAVNEIDHDAEDAISGAKAGMGAVIRDAVASDPLKTYGDPGLMSKVMSGEKVPEYLATIFANDAAKLRMAKSLLRTCGKQVTERTVFEIDERIA